MLSDLRTYIISAGIRTRLRRLGLAAERYHFECDSEIVDLDGIRLHVGPHLSPLMNWKILEGHYNRIERTLLVESRLGPHDVVLEFGTCIGHLAIVCAQQIGSDHVYSFEANEAMRPIIEEHCRLNNAQPAVRYQAVAAKVGEAVLSVASDPEESSLYGRAGADTRVVRTVAVNDLIHDICPTVLIVDIEGAEAEVLPVADLDRIRAVLIEMHPEQIGASTVNRLRRGVRAQGFRETSPDGRNYLYVRRTIPIASSKVHAQPHT